MPSNTHFFEALKKKSAPPVAAKSAPEVFFQLKFDETGAYLQIVDKKEKKLDADYRFYSGATRGILKSIDRIRNKQVFRIDWESPAERIYLAEYDFFLWQLQQCDNFVGPNFRPIHFADTPAEVVMSIEGDKRLTSKLQFQHSEKPLKEVVFLDESHVFSENTIFPVSPLGENFSKIGFFETTFNDVEVSKFLSLLYSYFDHLKVHYQDYRPVSGPPRTARPTLIFEKVDPDNSLYLRLSQSLSGFEADFLEEYDLRRVAVLNDLDRTIVISEVEQEDLYFHLRELKKQLNKHRRSLSSKNGYYLEDNLFIISEALAREFIYRELSNLTSHFAIFGAENLKTYQIRTVQPKLNLSLDHGIDFLEGEATLDVGEETFSLFEVLNQYKKQSYIRLSDGSHAIINQDYLKRLERLFKKKKDKVRLSFFDLPIVEELIDEKVARETFRKSRQIFLGFNDLQRRKIRYPKVQATLRSYQKYGYKWLDYLHRHKLGGCLADDMGLGKTLQAITLLSSVYPAEKSPSLVVMPRSLLFNWEHEILKFNPRLTYYIYHGPQRDLKAARQHNLILTTYATVRNDIEEFRKIDFYYLILDESQHIKNLNSQISKAAMLLKSRHRLALSGTPIENNLGELYSLFRFLNPAMFGSVEEFNRHYATPIQRENDKETVRELRKKIYPFILRRLKKDVLKDLPDKIEQVLYIDMNEDQKSLYESRRRFYHQTIRSQVAEMGIKKSQFFILQALNELRQLASIPEAKSGNGVFAAKRELLSEQLLDATANGHKVLVFANFLSALDAIAEDLESQGLEYLIMTGATRDRKALVERFQSDAACQVFLMTLKTGGLGLNLTAADTIFIYDPWWNIAAENQAVDRTHRIGQDKTVFSYKLITRGTIEEKMLLLQEKKRELFDSIIASDSASVKFLNEEDVDFLLGGQ